MAPPPSDVLPLPRWTIIIHVAQFLLAVAVLGLSAYGVHYIPYNALIFALVTVSTSYAKQQYIIHNADFRRVS